MIEDIKKACQVMREGGVILYPTDTIWGIGCDAVSYTHLDVYKRQLRFCSDHSFQKLAGFIQFVGLDVYLCQVAHCLEIFLQRKVLL